MYEVGRVIAGYKFSGVVVLIRCRSRRNITVCSPDLDDVINRTG